MNNQAPPANWPFPLHNTTRTPESKKLLKQGKNFKIPATILPQQQVPATMQPQPQSQQAIKEADVALL